MAKKDKKTILQGRNREKEKEKENVRPINWREKNDENRKKRHIDNRVKRCEISVSDFLSLPKMSVT